MEYLDAILNLKSWNKVDIEPTILDTTRDDSKYFKVLSQSVEHYPNFRVMHYEPNPKDNARMVHATALKIGRELALKEGFDFMLSVESDVIPNKADFINLYYSVQEGPYKMSLNSHILTGIVPYSKNATMLYKRLAINYYQNRIIQSCSIPTIHHNKSFFTELEVEQFREEKWIPQCIFYNLDDIKTEESFELNGCNLGFTLIPRKVLEDVHFRYVEASAAFPDVWFSFDAAAAGHRIFCNPKVRPKHLWRAWPAELKR